MLPNLDDVLPKLAGAKYFSKLDASSGFYQVPLHEDKWKLTTFITPLGRSSVWDNISAGDFQT